MPPTRENLDIVTDEVRVLLDTDPNISPALRTLIKLLLGFIQVLCAQKGLNSRNSAKPPATDPDRKKNRRQSSGRKPGGQPGHIAITLERLQSMDANHIKLWATKALHSSCHLVTDGYSSLPAVASVIKKHNPATVSLGKSGDLACFR